MQLFDDPSISDEGDVNHFTFLEALFRLPDEIVFDPEMRKSLYEDRPSEFKFAILVSVLVAGLPLG